MNSAGAPAKAIAPSNNPQSECAVKVAVRERPRQPADDTRASVVSTQATNERGGVIERPGAAEDNIIVVGDRPFVFDAVLGPAVGQQQLYESLVAPLVDKLLQGYFCTVLAYGQTGTGKSYTMGMHTEAFANDQGGVVPRTLRDIFDRVHASNADGSTETTLSISFIEIYNEKVIDLLAKSDEINTENIFHNRNANVTSSSSTPSAPKQPKKYAGPLRRIVRTVDEAQRALADGNRQRHIRPTKMNAQSSRSHAICTVHAAVQAANLHTVAAMHLVDLAGSEGVRRTGAQGAALAEGVNINQGLLSIGKVLQALSTGQRVIPYRDSVLSSVLQDSLNGNAFLTLLACISPLQADLSETLSTLRFAKGAKLLKLTPQVNAIVTQIQKTRTPAKLKTPSKHLLSTSSTLRTQSSKSCFAKRLTNAATGTPVRMSTASSATEQRPKTVLNGRRTFAASTPALQRGKALLASDAGASGHPAMADVTKTTDESLMFLDVSSSTTFDAPAQPFATLSYSPIVRRCVQQVEQSMGEQMRAMMQSFANDATLQPLVAAVPIEPIERITPINEDNNETTCVEAIATNVRRSLRNTSAGQINNMSWSILAPRLREIIRDEINAFQLNSVAAATTNSTTVHATAPQPQSIRNEENYDETAATMFPSFKEPSTTLRRNATMRAALPAMRSSARIAKRRQTILDGTSNAAEEVVLSKRRRHNNTDNDPLVNPTGNQQRHTEYVLGLFNKGTLRELQILPMIGPKLAYQIIMQRSMVGRVRNLKDMAAMPIWRGQSWDRFKAVNCLQ